MSADRIISVLHSGIWGTIGPYSLKAAELMARYSGAELCLLTHSAGSALEAALRSIGVYRGDSVIIPATATLMVRTCPNLTGAGTVLCGREGQKTTPSDIEEAVRSNAGIKCAVLDYDSTDKLDEISHYLSSNGIPLVLWMGGVLRKEYKAKPLSSWVTAVICSFAEESDIYAGNAGALLTNNRKIYDGAFAAHNCGRVPGDGATLEFDDAIGGNMRITEWQAAIIFDELSKKITL